MTPINLDTTPVRGLQAGNIPLSFQIRKFFVTARGEPIPPTERALGIDTSKWNGVMNWQTAYNAGARFAYFKATQGTTILDVQYSISRVNIGELMPWGAYHYLTNTDGTAQANWFCDAVESSWMPVLPPVLDVELATVDAAVIKAFCNRLYVRLGMFPMVYTSAYFWSLVTGDKAWVSARCQLFVAHWQTLSPLLPPGWTTYAVHQWSADGNGRGQEFGSAPDGDHDMDLDFTRQSWLNQYNPQPTLEQRVTALETEAREHGWDI